MKLSINRSLTVVATLARAWRSRRLSTGLVLLLAGCGADYDLAPVSGRITRDGQPVPALHVTFQPQAVEGSVTAPGPASVGETDADGIFHLKTVDGDQKGAVVGTHTVSIVSVAAAFHDAESGTPRPEEIKLPRRFSDGSVDHEVPASGTESADFDLSDE